MLFSIKKKQQICRKNIMGVRLVGVKRTRTTGNKLRVLYVILMILLWVSRKEIFYVNGANNNDFKMQRMKKNIKAAMRAEGTRVGCRHLPAWSYII